MPRRREFPLPDIAFEDDLCMSETALVPTELRLHDREIRLAQIDSVLIGARIYFGAKLVLPHLRINVAENVLDRAGNIGTDKTLQGPRLRLKKTGGGQGQLRSLGRLSLVPRDGHSPLWFGPTRSCHSWWRTRLRSRWRAVQLPQLLENKKRVYGNTCCTVELAMNVPYCSKGVVQTDPGWKAMKFLYLLRHAKSSWEDPDLNDHDRPLSKRGRQAAKLMAAYLRQSKIAPDLVICSTATRAQQTLEPIAKAKKPPKVILEREIYGGTQQALWDQLWNLPKSAKSVLLIGHNPALHDLAQELAQADSNKLLPSAGEKFPTGAMASFRFDGAWKTLEPHGAVLTSFITPKAIADIDTLTSGQQEA
jgi:phosphohistidine phosphatase